MHIWRRLRATKSPRLLFGLHKKLVLTYDSSKLTDGAGAQLQRIYGIYSISRLVGAAYLHSPLFRVDYQGLSALEANAGDPDYHHDLNTLFHIKSDVKATDAFHKISLPDISIEALHELVAMFDTNQRSEEHTSELQSLV